MSAELKFTVVVPTRQRADVLGPALQTIVAQDYDSLEILVSDNFSGDHTEDVVRSFHDPRLRYINTGSRLSMSHNWEFALSHVQDGWVAIVGDDDGLMPGALRRATEIAGEYGVSAICSHSAAYSWPSVTMDGVGRLTVGLERGCERRNSAQWLAKAVHGQASYSALPMLYTGGFVDSRLIEQARDSRGAFYRSMVPDVYSAVVFARMTESYAFCREPLAIGGSSKHSTGTSHFAGKARKDIKATPAKQFLGELNIPFAAELAVAPGALPPQSIELLIYESLLQSADVPGLNQVSTSHSEQLSIVLGMARRRHLEAVRAWARVFADQHGLDLEAAERRARRIRFASKIRKNLRAVQQRFSQSDLAGDATLPLADVYQASLAAASLRGAKSSRWL
jgi:glycosyltransferase involved in cell wall biosynthesis